jgi:hypothetical protein
MRSLPFPRRLQLVKLLRAHGLRDVERLREDELKEALARLSILMPDLTSEAPFVQPAPSSALSSSALSSSAPFTSGSQATDDDDAGLPRFREPRVFLPNNERTFVRAIAVKPRVVFATWDTSAEVPDGPARLLVYAAPYLGTSPSSSSLLSSPMLASIDIERSSSGWYLEVPAERVAVVLRLVVDTDDGPVVIATSNVALMPPSRPAPRGPLWMATLAPDVDRRTLRGEGLLRPRLPEGAAVVTQGEARPEQVLVALRAVADPPSSSFRFVPATEEAPSAPPSSLSSSLSSSSSSSSSLAAARPEQRA